MVELHFAELVEEVEWFDQGPASTTLEVGEHSLQ